MLFCLIPDALLNLENAINSTFNIQHAWSRNCVWQFKTIKAMYNILCKHRCGILWFIIQKNIFALGPHFWHKPSNFLRDENYKGVIFYVNNVVLGLHLRMETRSPYNLVIIGLEHSPRGEELEMNSIPNGQWFNQWSLCNKDKTKTNRRIGFRVLLGPQTHGAQEEWCT